jgi:ketosteroid isomerase-like protein
MKTIQSPGEQLLQNLLAAFNQGTENVLALFNPDATVEYPYAAAMGMSARLTLEDYRRHLDRILVNMPEIKFSSLRVFPLQQQDAYWAEVHGETTVPTKGALYEQDYVIFFELKNGKFSSYKEYWNALPVLKSLLPVEEAQHILNF